MSASAPSQPVNRQSVPRPVQLAIFAIIVQGVCGLLYGLLSWGYTDTLTRLILKNNADAKTPKALCSSTVTKNCLNISDSLHSFRITGTMYGVLILLILGLLIVRIRRGYRSGLWIYVAVSILGGLFGYAGSPITAFQTSGMPAAMRVVCIVAAVACIVAIVLMLQTPSRAYLVKTGRPAGAQRPARSGGLGGLFAPPPPRQKTPPAPAPSNTSDNPSAGRSKAKVRTDTSAIAKGAELARARAKASKSKSRSTPN